MKVVLQDRWSYNTQGIILIESDSLGYLGVVL